MARDECPFCGRGPIGRLSDHVAEECKAVDHLREPDVERWL